VVRQSPAAMEGKRGAENACGKDLEGADVTMIGAHGLFPSV
jgi:hypothetical protein